MTDAEGLCQGRKWPTVTLALMVLLLLVGGGSAGASDVELPDQGQWREYTTIGNPRADGLDLTLSYPARWEALDSPAPTVAKMFMAPTAGLSNVGCSVTISKLPVEAIGSEEEFAQAIVKPGVLQGQIPQGTTLAEPPAIQRFDGRPGYSAVLDSSVKRGRTTLYIRTLAQDALSKGRSINVSCITSGPTAAGVRAAFEKNRLTFAGVASSMKFAEPAPKPQSAYDSNLLLFAKLLMAKNYFGVGAFLLIALVMTLLLAGLLLVPPILVRYLLVRRPLSRGLAFALTAVLFVVDVGVMSALNGKPQPLWLMIVTLASFRILRRAGDRPEVSIPGGRFVAGPLASWWQAHAEIAREVWKGPKSNKLIAAFAVSLLPWVLIAAAAGTYKMTDSEGFSTAVAIAALVLSVGPLFRGIAWLQVGAGIPVHTSNERGVARLGHVLGLLFAPVVVLVGYLQIVDYSDRWNPAGIFLVVGPLAVCYLAARLLVRTAFWVRDGFQQPD